MSGARSFGWGQRFYHSLCPVALTGPEGLLPCSSCGMIYYSSPEAAEEHRSVHSPLCKLLAKLSKATGGLPPSKLQQVASISKLLLGRSLTQEEADMLMFPRACSLCHDPCPSPVYCTACKTAAYCSQDCQERDSSHALECASLESNREDYIYWSNNNLQEQVSSCLSSLPRPLPLHPSLSSLLPSLQLSLTTPKGRAVSTSLSCSLSTLLALPPSPNLVIHLVGARRIEVAAVEAWAVLPHHNIRLVMVGPECPDPVPSPDPKLELEFLPPCTYSSYCLSPGYQEPSLVCAFNCGFILYDSWLESLPHMLRASGAPLLFTEYYLQDCQANLDLLQETVQHSLEVVVPPCPNPWSSGSWERAPPMWGEASRALHRSSVICDNQHVAVVRRKDKE